MKPIRRVFALPLVYFLSTSAWADVTLTTYQRSGGFKGHGAFEGQSVEQFQGDKSRVERTVKYQNALMRMASGDRNQIIRVDLDKIWDLNIKKKTYTERSITVAKKPGDQAGEKPPNKPTTPGAPSPEKDEKPTHRLKRSDFTVKKTGEKKTINGFPTEHYLANAVVEVEEIATEEVTSFLLNTNIWTTAWTKTLRQANDEQMKFAKAYMQKLGFSMSADKNKTFDENSVRMLLGVGGPKTEEMLAGLRKKVDGIDGFPVATETIWTVKEDPKAVARSEKEKAQARKQAEAEESNIDTSGSATDIAGGLLGNFAKKKMREKKEKSDEKRAGEPVLSTYYEVKSVNTDALGTGQFDVPAGFKKAGK